MHFNDPLQLKHNILKLCLYKHSISDKFGKFDYEITSIYEARYIYLPSLTKLIYQFEYIFKSELDLLKPEIHYLVVLKNFNYSEFKIIACEEVKDSDPDNFKRLH